MGQTETASWVLLAIALIAANLPWVSERLLFFVPVDDKRVWMRLVEWLLLYVLVGAIAMGMEMKLYGNLHSQRWEFYIVTFCLFLVFALPGFLYRHVLRKLLERR